MPSAPKPHLSFPLLLLILKLQASLQLLQGGPADGILRALKLNDLVEHGSQLVEKSLERDDSLLRTEPPTHILITTPFK